MCVTRYAIVLALSNNRNNWSIRLFCPEKGASGRARAPTSSFGTKKTKALWKQVTGNGVLGACQDIVWFKTYLRWQATCELGDKAGVFATECETGLGLSPWPWNSLAFIHRSYNDIKTRFEMYFYFSFGQYRYQTHYARLLFWREEDLFFTSSLMRPLSTSKE